MEINPISQNPAIIHADVLPLFMRFCEEFSSIIAHHGFDVPAHNLKGIHQFSQLSNEDQMKATDGVRHSIQQIRFSLENNVPVTGDNRQHAWWSMKNLGLKPCTEDLFSKIGPDDFIEILDRNGLQVFRSFELFSHLSYTLSEMYSFSYVDLFERDEFVSRKINGFVEGVLSGKYKEGVIPQIPAHVVKERFSGGKHWVKMKHGIIAPLLNPDNSIGGLIATFSILDHGREINVPDSPQP